jgi:hypothetical protein
MKSHSETMSPLVLSVLTIGSHFGSDFGSARRLHSVQKVIKLESLLSAKCQGNKL